MCGFDRCRAPLPVPGPRGGRPYEYCPDRVWPGGKSCKQLAAAQEALREALGEPTDTPVLTAAAATVATATDQVLPAVRELLDALTSVRAAADAELAAAAARVQEAEDTAARERGSRQAAEARAEQAAEAAARAREASEQAEAARVTAEQDRDAHRRARKQAEQAAQHAEGRATATQTELNRVHIRMGEVEARLSDTVAELAASRAAVAELERRSARAAELEERLTEMTGELAASRAAAARAGELETRLAEVTGELAGCRATAEADRVRADAAERRVRDLGGQLDAVHTRVDGLQERHERALAEAYAATDRVRGELTEQVAAARAGHETALAELRAGMRELGEARRARDQAVAVVEWAGRLADAVRGHVDDPAGRPADGLKVLLDARPSPVGQEPAGAG